jgi:hypothetical protein
MTIGAVLLSGVGTHTAIGWLLLAYVPFGAGFGLINPPITNTAVSGMPMSQAGVAAAIASTSRQAGQSFGVAVIGSIATSMVATARGAGALGPGFVSAARPGWWVIAGCGLLITALGIVTTGAWAQRTAATVADRLSDHAMSSGDLARTRGA